MGRNEPSWAPSTQQSFRKDQRAKYARMVINKSIPKFIASDARARQGIENARLIPPTLTTKKSHRKPADADTSSRSKWKSKGQDKSKVVGDDDDQQLAFDELGKDQSSQTINIRIEVADTLAAAFNLHKSRKSRKNVAVLNMASPLRPGGGVLNGATSQEESLCLRTTLLSSPKEEWYRLPEVGGIFSPDVLCFKVSNRMDEADLAKKDHFYIDVVTAAMMRFPDTEDASFKPSENLEAVPDTVEKVYLNQKDRELAQAKIRAVLQILQSRGVERVILGAWGCGAYGNPVNEIAHAFKQALLGPSTNIKRALRPSWEPLKEVVFAIKEAKMASAFAHAWGDDIELLQTEEENDGQSVDEEQSEELLRKIQDLESQILQARTPMLKQGLEATLHNLEKQLQSVQE